jgi:hypothetical protein
MINTLNIKQQQLSKGAFKVGSGNEVVLIMGSCRSVPYLNYLNEWNKNTNRFTIYFIDPFNWHWNNKEERVDYEQVLKRLETDDSILNILSTVKIFIHEYYKNFGMFNTIIDGDINIYEFGMKPETDICIPNFNDLFILVNDIVKFDKEIRLKISSGLFPEQQIKDISNEAVEKFYSVCRQSDIPEMEEYFRENFTKVRLFWTHNHIAKGFSLAIFKFMNDKFLKLELTQGYWDEISKDDMYANNYTHLTEYDIKFYNYQYNEQIIPVTL